MHGNADEWVEDEDAAFSIQRGGSWLNYQRFLSSASRNGNVPNWLQRTRIDGAYRDGPIVADMLQVLGTPGAQPTGRPFTLTAPDGIGRPRVRSTLASKSRSTMSL